MASAAQILRQYRENEKKEKGARSGAPASASEILRKLREEQASKASPSLSPAASLYAKKKEDDEEKNKGGLLGGLGYLGHKIGLGFMQGIEGIWDYAAGGIADLFGADEWAEEQFKSDWLDYNAADEWYNPGEGWKFAGDVAGGIGTSLPGIVTSVGLTVATGGAALPAVAGIGVGSLSAAGTSTKEAMLESGELTGKEYLYGAGMGAVEAVTEKLTGGIGAGVTKAAKSVGKVLGKVAVKEVAESAAKKSVALSLKTAAKSAAKEFAGEAFEEGFAEWVAPYIARATYDPNAKNASAQEIFYSALVGGLAGVGMGGATGALTQGINYHSGKSIVNNGRTQQILDLAKTYTEDGASDTEAANGIRELYGKLSSAVQSGAGLNREQQRMLGELAAFETQEQLRPMVQRSAIHAIQSADAVAERLNAVGRYKMVDGKLTDTQANNSIHEGTEVREITAEDIRGTYDPKNKKSLAEALKTNDVLRYIAASDAAGRLMLTAQDVERSVLTGTRIHTQAELNEFITSASAERKAAVGKELGIEDWNTLTVEAFAKKASAYRESGKAEAYKKKAAKVQKMQGLAESKARNIPRAIALADGAVQRYADADSNFAVARDGDTYIVYDYATGNVTRDMTRAEVNAALGRYRRSRAGGEISRSDVENYQKRLSAWDGVTEGFSFVLGDTSAVLKDIEVDGKKIGDKQIRLDATKAKSILKEHSEMDIEVLKSLPKITENPIIALESKTQKGRFVLFGEVTAKNGRPVMVAIELNPKTRSGKTTYLDIIKIASAYTRTNTQNLIDTSKIIYVDKNSDRVTNWLKVNRLQLPLPNQKSNSVNNSIPDSAEKVNTSDEKSAKSLSEMLPMEEKTKPTAKQVKAAMEAKAQAAAIESLAKEKIKDYTDLSKENQSMIRKVLREAMASGISEADALSYARVAARSGLDTTFDKKACYNEEKGTYAAGFYDPENNRIVINPETKKKHVSLLIHELSHAIRSYIGKDGKRHAVPMIDDPDKISDAMWEKIEGYYADQEITVERAELMADEASAYYAEQMLGTDAAIDLLLGEKPTLQQKILSFFKKSAQDYSSDEALSRESRKFLRNFKKTFDAFAARNRGRNIKAGNAGDQSARRFSFEGRTEDGRGIYKSNYPKNTPKDIKQRDIVNLVQNVWSEKPIKLNLIVEGKNVPIEARFNPVLTERSDLSKIAFGNRKGTASEKRITMNLSADLYQIAEESHHVGSKAESGKDNAAHDNVAIWHYFITNLVYIEEDGTEIDCYMNIDVKQNESGNWFYSFAIEKGSRPADVLSVVTDKSATTSDFIIPDSAQKVNTSDKNSFDSRRYAMEEEQKTKKASNDPNKVTISKGQAQKVKANYSSDRVFSKKDVTDAFMGIEGFSNLPYEIRNELFDNIWIGMNSRYSNKNRKNFVQGLLPKIHHTLLTEALTAEGIEKHKKYRALLKKKRTVEQKLQGEALKKAQAKIDRAIDRELAPLVGPSNRLFDNYDRDRIEEIRHEIAVALKNLLASGKSSTLAKTKKEFDATNAGFWRGKYYEATDRNRLLNYLDKQARELRDLKIGKYKNMTQPHNDMFKGSIGRLANIEWKGTPNDKMIRSACRDVYAWYTNGDVMENILFYAKNGDGTVRPGLYNEGIAEALKDISAGKGALSTEELQAMSRIMMYFTNFVEKYGKVYRKGQWVDAYLEVERYINQMNKNKRLRVGLIGKIAKTDFFKLFGDPMSLARRMDYYESGFYTEMLEEMREGAINAAVYEMDIVAKYEAFLKENKNYTKKAAEEVVTYRDVQIPKMQLISLYMTLKRRDSRAGFVLNGFEFGVGEGTVDVNGLVSPFAQIEDAEVNSKAEAEIRRIEGMLSEKDRAFISVLESAYNGDLKDLKSMRDMQRLGYTNAKDGYYYPQRRVGRSESVDSSTVFDEINRLNNASFNKSTVKGDKHKLYIEAADALFLRHVRAVCQYAALQPAMDAYHMLFNLDISGNPNDPHNVAKIAKTVWPKGNEYYRNIIADIQGARSKSGDGAKLLSAFRSGYAKFQLGANPKVLLTQLSSGFAASSILDADVIVSGMLLTFKGGDDVDRYCDLARHRNYDDTAARAQGVLDQPLSVRETKTGKLKKAAGAVTEATGKVGDLAMKPIGFMDRLTVKGLFVACQKQIEKDGGAKVGMEENKIEAGKLLTRVILETQQNSLATERSAAMRSGNEFYRALTMFRSDSMKVFGRVLDSVGEFQTLKARMKLAGTEEEKGQYQTKLKKAGKKVFKSCIALLSSAAYMVGVSELFRWLYAKEEEEDETAVERILVDLGGNLLGGLPIFADLYARFFEGYDLDNFAYSSINDLADSVANFFSAVTNFKDGTAQQKHFAMRSLAYSVSQLLGIPLRNAYNMVYGLTKRVSKKAGYAIDNAFYEKNYKTDLYKAMENGNDDMTTYIMGLLLGERLDQSMDDVVFSEILALSKKGYKVLPRTMPKTLTVNDEEYELTDEEQAALRAEYSAYTEGLSRLVSHRSYAALTDEEKEYAMDYVSDLYYDMALQSALGVERENKDLILSRALSVDTLALYRTSVRGLASDKDKDGNTVAGSKRKKVIQAINALGVRREERLLLIASAGYSLKDGDVRGMSAEVANNLLLRYILSMKISKDEKATLAQACGFTVKNGKILKKSA